jgi:hypothetical protein
MAVVKPHPSHLFLLIIINLNSTSKQTSLARVLLPIKTTFAFVKHATNSSAKVVKNVRTNQRSFPFCCWLALIDKFCESRRPLGTGDVRGHRLSVAAHQSLSPVSSTITPAVSLKNTHTKTTDILRSENPNQK